MPNPKLETYKNKATNTVYDLTDAAAQASIITIESKIPSGASSSNKMATESEIEDIWDANARTGVHNQLNVQNVIAGHSKAVISNVSSNGFTVATSEAAANVASKNVLDLVVGARYKVSVTTTNDNAAAMVAIRDSNSIIKEYVATPTAGSYSFEFTFASGYYFAAFCTGSSSATGTLTVSNLMITPLEDTCTDVTPYAMTNKELTDAVEPVDITNDWLTLPEDITLGSNVSVLKIGKQIIVNAVLIRSEGFTENTQFSIPINNKYRPVKDINTNAVFQSSQWTALGNLGYLYVGNNLDIRNMSTTVNFCKINMVYVCK